jgi:hypothetical protein
VGNADERLPLPATSGRFPAGFASTIFFGTKDELREGEVWDCGRGHFFDQMRLWFGKENFTGRRKPENIVTLAPPL